VKCSLVNQRIPRFGSAHTVIADTFAPPCTLRTDRLHFESETFHSDVIEIQISDNIRRFVAMHLQTSSEYVVTFAVADRVKAKVVEVVFGRESGDCMWASIMFSAASIRLQKLARRRTIM